MPKRYRPVPATGLPEVRAVKHFTLTISCENAAFEENLLAEVQRILLAEASYVEHVGLRTHSVFDANGNRVGSVIYHDPGYEAFKRSRDPEDALDEGREAARESNLGEDES